VFRKLTVVLTALALTASIGVPTVGAKWGASPQVRSSWG